MSSYSVQFSEVAQVIEDMTQATNSIQSTLSDLNTQVRTTLDYEHWTSGPGGAKDQYAYSQDKWNKDCEEMHQMLLRAQKSLTQIYENYGLTEKQAADMWASVGL